MDDLISRQDAIEILRDTPIDIRSTREDDIHTLYATAQNMAIEALSAQPERKKGEWNKISPAGIYECSECGKNVMTADIEAYEFCHGCGAKMEVEHDECVKCGFYDADYGCTCSSVHKWYACPIENKKPENIQALKEYEEWCKDGD